MATSLRYLNLIRKARLADSFTNLEFKIMQKRQLGSTDLSLTTIGVGTWAIGGKNWLYGWGDQATDESIAGMKRAIELGVNWIDTAPIYGLGESERVVGKFLADLPTGERPLVATKFGRVENPDKTIGGNLQPSNVVAESEASLKNLGVECIDLLQMHWPDPEGDIELGWEAAAKLVKQGKVRHIGVSNQTVAQMERLINIHPIASLQPPYNMFQKAIEDSTLDFCDKNRIGVVAYSPMAKGLLTGSFSTSRAASLPDDDHRSRDPKFASPQLEINLEFVDSIRPIAESNNRPLAQLAIAWCLRRPELTSAIVGIRRPAQIEQTVAASDWSLTDDEIAIVDEALGIREQKLASLKD